MSKFRFFHCGEYGDQNGRPHYHACIFGQDFRENSEPCQNGNYGDPQYTSPLIQELWGMGLHSIGTLNFNSAAYVARYIMKKQTGKNAREAYGTKAILTNGPFGTWHEELARKPEYITMSRRPGIGKTWIETFLGDVYPSDQVIVNGNPARPPRFYDDYLESIDRNMYLQIKAKRTRNADKYSEEQTPDRLNEKRIFNDAKALNQQRKI